MMKSLNNTLITIKVI